MKVAVFGSYNYGNYGDDLMGVMFAHKLKQLDAEPIVYRLDPVFANTYDVQTTDSLDELLSNARFCIIGGGGLLIGKTKLSKIDQEIEDDFKAFALATQQYSCPLYPLSVGGDGRGENTPFPSGRRLLFSGPTCQLTTVRNKSDIPLMKHLGKEAVYYPDVLWSAPDYWNMEKPKHDPNVLRIGINLADSRKHRMFVSLLSQLSKLKRQKIELHLIRSHLANYPVNYEMLPIPGQRNLFSYTYSDPVEMLAFLGSLDVLISQKLHLGLSALAMGVPFISYGGQGKTHTLLKSIGAEQAIASTTKFDTFALAVTIAINGVKNIRNIYDFKALATLSSESQQHLSRLETLVQQYSVRSAA
ncbi:MAG: polysaccharide pyruvyl transferase family protein [Cyanobacteria bacterium P01_F01_bin.53]